MSFGCYVYKAYLEGRKEEFPCKDCAAYIAETDDCFYGGSDMRVIAVCTRRERGLRNVKTQNAR